MKVIFILALLMAAMSSALAGRYDQSPNSYLVPAESATQSKLDEAEYRLDQIELERQLEYEDQLEAADKAREAAEEAREIAKREAEELAEQARQEAEDRATEIANREIIAGANNRNLIYKVFITLILSFSLYKIISKKRNNKENKLNSCEKVGVIIVTFSIFILFSVLFLSSLWLPQLDFWQNIMQDYMTIDFWPYIKTKYIVLFCIALTFYGVLIYLEVIKPPKFLLSRFDQQ